MKIGPEEQDEASQRRRWGVPVGVAAGVVAVSVAAVTAFGGAGDAKPIVAGPAGNPTGAASPSPSTTTGSASGGAGSSPSSGDTSSARDAFTITSGATTPIDAATITRILASCLGKDASRYQPVIGVRAPITSKDSDGVVIAVDSAGQYVQCESKGDKGTSPDSPPTFINDRLWGTGRTVEYFDSIREPAGKGQYLMLGAGHYTSGITKITISYGDDPKEYPAAMAGGAFVYAAALSPDTPPEQHYAGPSPYVHAYNASGKEVYNQKKDPQFTE
ncbi:hypothetical protein ACIBL6_14105 [Streptomyces sp. NPDC050400]|uniref:hypothetical protein n=1 Tax=Streptomyces sp. NPDC050400 TaxID=3365610 RepID=UPI0037B5FE63